MGLHAPRLPTDGDGCADTFLLCCCIAARNDRLVIDLGGVHNPMQKTFDLDSLNLTEARALRAWTSLEESESACADGLHSAQGSAVSLSFFFAERRSCGSEFRVETSIVPVKGSCTIWGDPHISVFDSGLFGADESDPVSILTSGDYWLVKNQDISIQGVLPELRVISVFRARDERTITTAPAGSVRLVNQPM